MFLFSKRGLHFLFKFAGETREGWSLLTVETEVNGDLWAPKEYL
jgi:hypothetical protein